MNEYFMIFFFNDPATTEIYTLSLHDALPIYRRTSRSATAPMRRSGSVRRRRPLDLRWGGSDDVGYPTGRPSGPRLEEHTSELPSRQYFVCRLLLEKKKTSYVPHAVTSGICPH